MTPAEMLSARWTEQGLLLDFARKHMCQAPGCVRRRKSISYCGMHDMRFMRHGDISVVKGSGGLRQSNIRALSMLDGQWVTTSEFAAKLGRTHACAFKQGQRLLALGLAEKAGGVRVGCKWRATLA